MKLKPINKQVVVVFGASSGIGRLTALRFAERGAKVIVAGGAAKAGIIAQQLAPGLFGAILSRAGFTMQRTDEPKSARAPDNLFQPLEDETRIEGDFGAQAKRGSSYTWGKTHPAASAALAGAALGGSLLLLASRLSTNNEERSRKQKRPHK